MKITNTLFCILTVFLFHSLDGFSSNREAWKKFESAKYQTITEQPNSDATIIFDRSYTSTNEVNYKVVQTNIIHKKYKINSLYALEQLNKVYIRVINDLHYKSELINVKVKAINSDNNIILTDTSQLVTTVLPANYSSYYKVDGNLKMLAIQGIELGDQVEIIYEIRRYFDTPPYRFYDSDEILFSDEFYCIEKSIYLESNDFDIKMLLFNANKNHVKETSAQGRKIFSIKLNNLEPLENQFYSNSYLDRIYVKYLITLEIEESTPTWEEIAENLQSRNKSFKRQEVFQESKLSEITEKFNSIPTTKRKFQYLLESINKSLEKNPQYYEYVKEDIDIAWANACMISTLLQKLEVPVSFHFVVNKNYGSFNPKYFTIYQFDKIFLSFNWKGKKHYLPLLEPYSEFDEISSNYSGTECLSIIQSKDGKKQIKFDKMPDSTVRNQLSRKIDIEISSNKNDSIILSVNEILTFEGNAYLDLKPYVKEYLNNEKTELKDEFIKDLVLYHVLPLEKLDSVKVSAYSIDSGRLKVDVSYKIFKEVFTKNNIFSLSPKLLVLNDYYTPFHLKKIRNSNGYLYNETDFYYEIKFKSREQLQYFTSEEKESNIENELAKIYHNVNKDDGTLKIDFSISYKIEKFEQDQWSKVVKIRDKCHQLLSQNIYIQSK